MKTSVVKGSSAYGTRKNSFSNNASPLHIQSTTKENRGTTSNNTNNIFQIPDMSSQWKYLGNNTSNLNQSTTTAKNTSEIKQNDPKLLTTNVFINNLNIQIKPTLQPLSMGANSNLPISANKKILIPQLAPTSGYAIKRTIRKSPKKNINDDREDYKDILNSKMEDIRKVSNVNDSSNYIEKFMNNSNKQNYPQYLINKNDNETLNNRAIKIAPNNSYVSSKST